jgi:hypothetical protein
MRVLLMLWVSVTAVVAVSSAAAAEPVPCLRPRYCSPSEPCYYLSTRPITCGSECEAGNFSGASGCQTVVDPAHPGCLKAVLSGIGCCTTPCPPPSDPTTCHDG